ncbi:hypothetical protein JMN10_05495 [Capnocytophaga genosp. AHN8471]|jgi:hypothetical protein|uniref:XRE family transcriptional regulator n=1 Tax=Capnocytophaga genosp. AHN8471 TaxID=327574 RepID=A0ABS1YX39_9FLAO|nr:hypothetical protein [Capnocytophaga genosp. AHN8471]MBM0650976.1 hypothetical protein [Capnocytophaga genosp. AHN8471]MBM0661642.1 hypothetical protein [Capnocytophaga genosp. AHN8471]
MEVTNLIIQKILNDNNFSIELAKRLGVQQQSVLGLARRNSRNLTLWEAVVFYKEQGFSEEQIFQDFKANKAVVNEK